MATRVLRMAAAKRTTGLVGLAVVPDAREKLIDMYNKTLEKVKVIPAEVEYRKSVEQITNFRLGVCQKFADLETIEKEIDCGQVEELLVQAKEEFELIDLLKDSSICKVPAKA
eukprot:CAMPEP_0184519564 /NCGR_PEP_ID=MMETSP0198_2-20121128/6697_1 /TAXON_ID=1112570 /ORGANISM="Thraustochytrium sp., Strain LLF1b" /LENGTH=112 /DNA_ID=CAMNT_0026910095 /DNA_START=238 /DNA_END=576 /DNA_ORIENTATION=-